MHNERAGMAFIGCLVIGTGVGFITENIHTGGMIGLGIGLLMTVLLRKR